MVSENFSSSGPAPGVLLPEKHQQLGPGMEFLAQKLSCWILFGAATQVVCAGLSTVLLGRFQPHLMPQCGKVNTIIIMLTKSIAHEY